MKVYCLKFNFPLAVVAALALSGCVTPYHPPLLGDTAKITFAYDGGGPMGSASTFYFLRDTARVCEQVEKMAVIDYGNFLVGTDNNEFYTIPAGKPVSIEARIMPHGAPYIGHPCEASVLINAEAGVHYFFKPEYLGFYEGCSATLTGEKEGQPVEIDFRMVRPCR